MTPTVRTYRLPPVDREEVFRYAGCPHPTDGERTILDECLAALPESEGRVCFAKSPVIVDGDRVVTDFCTISSRSLAAHLAGCAGVVAFAATVGIGYDRLIHRFAGVSPVRSLFYQAIGAERIEALCDAFCEDLRTSEPRIKFRSRFSPGYGDLPLTLQTDLFRVLDCERKIGLTLNRMLLMTPTKSVTALVGMERN